jgi:hypothetical protein
MLFEGGCGYRRVECGVGVSVVGVGGWMVWVSVSHLHSLTRTPIPTHPSMSNESFEQYRDSADKLQATYALLDLH